MGFSICIPWHFSIVFSYVCNLKILKYFSQLNEAFPRRKITNDCCYRLTSSNVSTVKDICGRWYRYQFNKFEKGWARVALLCLDFRKTPPNQNRKSNKVATFKVCEIFSNYYFSYVRDYKDTLAGGINIM